MCVDAGAEVKGGLDCSSSRGGGDNFSLNSILVVVYV